MSSLFNRKKYFHFLVLWKYHKCQQKKNGQRVFWMSSLYTTFMFFILCTTKYTEKYIPLLRGEDYKFLWWLNLFSLYTCDDKAPEASLQPSALLLHQGHPVQVVHQVAASIRHHQGLTMGTCSPEHAGQIRYPPLESQHPHKMVTTRIG